MFDRKVGEWWVFDRKVLGSGGCLIGRLGSGGSFIERLGSGWGLIGRCWGVLGV